MSDLEDFQALVGEAGGIMAFRQADDDGKHWEPIMMELTLDPEAQAVAMQLSDSNGLSLGRYMIKREDMEALILK